MPTAVNCKKENNFRISNFKYNTKTLILFCSGLAIQIKASPVMFNPLRYRLGLIPSWDGMC